MLNLAYYFSDIQSVTLQHAVFFDLRPFLGPYSAYLFLGNCFGLPLSEMPLNGLILSRNKWYSSEYEHDT